MRRVARRRSRVIGARHLGKRQMGRDQRHPQLRAVSSIMTGSAARVRSARYSVWPVKRSRHP